MVECGEHNETDKTSDVKDMMIFCIGSFSAVGPPLIRRSKSFGSFFHEIEGDRE
jgi:hypothetical protein